MNKEKDKVTSHKTASSRQPSRGGSNAKKVVSKAASKPVTQELNRRSSSDGAKRTSSAQTSSRKKSTRKKSSKRKTPEFLRNLPTAARFLLKLGCVVLVLVLIVSIWTAVSGWAMGDLFSHSVQVVKDWGAYGGQGNDFPLTLSGSHSIKQEKIGDGLAVLTDTTLTIYGKNGHTARSQAHYMANPALAAESSYALVYDIGGDRWRFETASETLCTGEADSSILYASVSRSGYFVLVCSDDNYHSSVAVYNRSGDKIFGWKCANYYITSAAINSNSTLLTVCGLNAEGGLIKSAVYVLDITDRNELTVETFSDELLLDVCYLKSGKAVVIGSDSIITVSEKGDSIEALPLDNRVVAYDFDYSSGVVYCTSPVEGSSIAVLTALDTEGRQRFSQQLSCYITDVAISSDYVSVLSQGFGAVYSIEGSELREFEVTVDAKKIELIGDYSFILCNTVLRRENI